MRKNSKATPVGLKRSSGSPPGIVITLNGISYFGVSVLRSSRIFMKSVELLMTVINQLTGSTLNVSSVRFVSEKK